MSKPLQRQDPIREKNKVINAEEKRNEYSNEKG